MVKNDTHQELNWENSAIPRGIYAGGLKVADETTGDDLVTKANGKDFPDSYPVVTIIPDSNTVS